MKRIVLVLLALSLFAVPAFARNADIVKFNNDIEIAESMTVNDAVVVGGDIIVYGRVENNAVAVGGSVILKARSRVGGEVVVVGGKLVKDPLAEIGGKATQVYMPNFIPSFMTFLRGGWMALWTTISILVFLGFLGLAVLLAALIPDKIGVAVHALEKSFLMMFLWGMLWMVLIVPIALLLAISIVGIVLIPLEILLAALAFIIGYVAAAIYIGKSVLLYFRKIPLPFVDAVLGIVILFLVGFVPVAGAIIKAVFIISGFGAVVTSRFGTVK